MNPRVTTAEAIPDFRLLVTFTNGERRIFDVSPYLQYPAFKSLNNTGYFSLAQASHGTVCWPNNIDFCPDMVYLESVPEAATPPSEQAA